MSEQDFIKRLKETTRQLFREALKREQPTEFVDDSGYKLVCFRKSPKKLSITDELNKTIYIFGNPYN